MFFLMTVVVWRLGLQGLSFQTPDTGDQVHVGVYMMYASCNHLIKENTFMCFALRSVAGSWRSRRILQDDAKINYAQEDCYLKNTNKI